MRKIALLAGATIMALGLGAASSSAFAMGCLTSQDQMVTPSLTANTISEAPSTGGSATALPPAYNIAEYNTLVAKGNACPTTEQSLPIGQQQSNQGFVYQPQGQR
jgi:hypothetical protein